MFGFSQFVLRRNFVNGNCEMFTKLMKQLKAKVKYYWIILAFEIVQWIAKSVFVPNSNKIGQ